MTLSRPYPALAGVVALLLVAGIVAHQTFVMRESADPAPPMSPAPSVEAETVAERDEPTSEPLIVALEDGRIAKAAPESATRSLPVESSYEVAVAEHTRAASEVRSLAARAAPETVEAPALGYRDQGHDRFTPFDTNPVKVAAEQPVSTFSIDGLCCKVRLFGDVFA